MPCPPVSAKGSPLKTFRRNVSKTKKQQAGRRAERSCSLRPRKAVAFLTHLLRAPEARAQGISLSADSDLEGTCPLRTPRQLRSAGAAFSGTVFQNLFVSARYFLLSAFVGTRRAVSDSFSKGKSVGNVPPERFQNHDTANGTQGGAVLFAPPSKSCRFSHPPSPRAQKQGRREFRCLRTAT